MRQVSYHCFAVAFCAIFSLSAGSASAQINPFPGNELALSDSDLAVIEEVASGLIAGKVVPDGTTIEWYNGETHRRGSIRVLESSQLDGRPCHKLRYTLPVRSPQGSRAYDLTWCKAPDGDWKIVSK
ncbi:MAG: hypothetical protein JSS43_29360 [Proteobacteria bacterium]|nr:hypothetical protein [Pseudomonadota bacterium]